jgi:hypothetical protein
MPPEGVDHRRVMGLAMRIHSGDDMHVLIGHHGHCCLSR